MVPPTAPTPAKDALNAKEDFAAAAPAFQAVIPACAAFAPYPKNFPATPPPTDIAAAYPNAVPPISNNLAPNPSSLIQLPCVIDFPMEVL